VGLSWSLGRGAGRTFNIARLGSRPQATEELSLHPRFPGYFIRPNDYLICIPNEREPKQRRFLRKFLQPSFVRKLRVPKTEFIIALRASINQRRHAKFLGESAKLSERCRAFKKIHEMGFYPSLREEAKCFTRIRTFLNAKYLDFQPVTLVYRNETK
jgi:hypothetical protein